jgi:thiamine-phosphate pyrophosphorylase
VAFGSFFASRVKPGAVRAPLDLLTRAKAALTVPVVAIGGIAPENAAQLARAGADAIAVISALFDAPDVTAAAQKLIASFGASHE